MKRIVAIGLLVLSIFAAAGVAMALDSSTTRASISPVPGTDMRIVKYSWVTSTLSVNAYAELDAEDGFIYTVVTDPGSVAPADNYDIYLKDYLTGANLGGTSFEDRDTANSEAVNLTTPIPFFRNIGFSISGNGNLESTGDVYLFIGPNR